MNWYGARKYTDYVAAFLAGEYNMKSHYREDGYESWHEAVNILKKEVEAAQQDE